MNDNSISETNSDALFDIKANRASRKYSPKEILARVVWRIFYPLYRFSPRILYGWRNLLLRIFGAEIGSKVRIHQTAHIRYPWLFSIGDNSSIGESAIVYNLGPIYIGNRSTISQNAHLCAGTHDLNDKAFPLVRASIKIGSDCWICADAFVGPHVRVGDGAVVAARAVAVKDVEEFSIVGGNPAKMIKKRSL